MGPLRSRLPASCASALVVAALAAGCAPGGCIFRLPPDSGAITFTCALDANDCPPGRTCVSGICETIASDSAPSATDAVAAADSGGAFDSGAATDAGTALDPGDGGP